MERYMASSMTGWSVDGQSNGDEVARPEDEPGRTGEAGAEEYEALDEDGRTGDVAGLLFWMTRGGQGESWRPRAGELSLERSFLPSILKSSGAPDSSDGECGRREERSKGIWFP